MRYNISIECNEQQAHLIEDALEEYFRIRMNQFYEISDGLAFDGLEQDRNENGDIDKEAFDKRLRLRDDLNNTFTIIGNLHNEAMGSDSSRSEDCRNVSDIWSCFRHELFKTEEPNTYPWDVRGRTPIQLGEFDLPKIVVKIGE